MEQRQDSASPGRIYLRAGKEWPNLAQVDWRRAPGMFKRYTDCASLPLNHGASPSAIGDEAPSGRLGPMLAAMYGVTRVRWTPLEAFNSMVAAGMALSPHTEKRAFHVDMLRPVPSGGGLFPGELYLVTGEGQEVPAGVYHYDPPHHALDIIRTGASLAAVCRCLVDPGHASTAFALIVSCFFWKNAFKYGEFSYRLHCLDLGVLLAQCMEVAQPYGLRGTVNYQFLDDALNEILGLDPLYESVYAVVTFRDPSDSWQRIPERAARPIENEPACQSIAAGTPALSSWPLLEALHRASMIQNRCDFRPLQTVPPPSAPAGLHRMPLSGEREIRLVEGIDRRRSARQYFQPGAISRWQFTQIVLAAAQGYRNDIDGETAALQHTLLYCAVNNVEGIEPGIYCYAPAEQALIPVREGNVSPHIQHILPGLTNANPSHISLSIFPVGSYEDGFSTSGDRWYRIQNMEAGMAIQRLYLAAATLKLGCHTALAYRVNEADHLLSLAPGLTTLGLVMIAPERVAGQFYEIPVC